MKRNYTGPIALIIVVILIVFLGFLLFRGNGSDLPEANQGQGRIFFSITDDTADIESVKEVSLEVKEIEVYNEAQGWTTISSDERKYDLLKLKSEGKAELHTADAVDVGEYDKVRLTLGDVVIDHESRGEVDATLPSSQIVFNTNIQVRNQEDSYIEIDFIADESLHITTDNEYIFAAVVEVQTRNGAEIEISDKDRAVTVSGSSVDSTVQVGVDLTGETKENFKLDSSAGLNVDVTTTEGTRFMLGNQVYLSGQTASNSEGNNELMKEDTGSVSGILNDNAEGSVDSGTDIDVGI
ncbi:MAG: hypothetical protein COV70_00510 [Parcubacteria group bacterium CG11_big_fil_rev_8_21_14_0_20_39_22]|nr:MAG: hypothetical protein COV70_00510 [Parcubacteria group bacterium CG11_big_fil_rev_8_21_14_0_20_39_22]